MYCLQLYSKVWVWKGSYIHCYYLSATRVTVTIFCYATLCFMTMVLPWSPPCLLYICQRPVTQTSSGQISHGRRLSAKWVSGGLKKLTTALALHLWSISISSGKSTTYSVHVNKATQTHTTALQHDGAERSFYRRSLVFQVVISSHCCSSTYQKSHKPMRVIISSSGKKKRPA